MLDAQAYFDRVSVHLPGDAATRARAWAAAEELGLRVIVPFVNTVHYEDWGSIHTYSRWVGVDPHR